MITPEKVAGENKIRDAKIIGLYLYEDQTQEEIAVTMGISRTRVGAILYNNRSLLVAYGMDKDYEKAKRVQYYKRMANKASDGVHDAEYWLNKIQAEVDGPAETASAEVPNWMNGRLTGVN